MGSQAACSYETSPGKALETDPDPSFFSLICPWKLSGVRASAVLTSPAHTHSVPRRVSVTVGSAVLSVTWGS